MNIGEKLYNKSRHTGALIPPLNQTQMMKFTKKKTKTKQNKTKKKKHII